MRENAIYCMGMGHPLIRQMFHEISARLIRGGATSHIDDIYWLTKFGIGKTHSTVRQKYTFIR